jgi:hypothetical protein
VATEVSEVSSMLWDIPEQKLLTEHVSVEVVSELWDLAIVSAEVDDSLEQLWISIQVDVTSSLWDMYQQVVDFVVFEHCLQLGTSH